ncbi:MAG: hypothetical protein O9278_06505 [Flavobacterium sp.]|nr:hypothetical protein [Flavobacterium sp.]
MVIKPFVTGITDTGELLVTKGIGSLLVLMGRTPDELTTEKISVWVERSGKNVDLAKDLLLKDFLLLTTFAEDAILSNATYKSIALCDLTEDGGFIYLAETETIKVRLYDLISTVSYGLMGIEEPVASKELLKFERKTISADDITRDIDCKGFDLMSLQKHSSITEVQLMFDNGATCKYNPTELEAQTLAVDQIQYINQAGSVTSASLDRIVIPLHGIVQVTISKNSGTRLECAMRIDEGDYELYQMSNR